MAHGVANADIIYQQNFGLMDTNRVPLANVGWTSLSAVRDGGDVTNVQRNAFYVGVVNTTGKPIDAPNVNAGTSASDTTGVLRFYSADNQFFETLAFTEQYAIDRSVWQMETISFYAARTAAVGGTVRAALKIDGIWYVSDARTPVALSSNTDAAFATSAGLIEIDFNLESWYQLTASVGSPFFIGETPVSLSAGNIDAFGVFAVPRNANDMRVMIDTFSITGTAIPEPSTAMLFLLFGGGLALRRIVRR